MKLTNKIALISTLGCLALVGTGFAAYVYSTGDSKTGTASVVGAGKSTEAGVVTVTIANGSGITLDSVKEGGVQKLDENGKIQSVATWKSGSAAQAKFTPAAGNNADTSYLTRSYTVTMTNNVYVSLSGTVSGTWSDNTPVALPTLVCEQTKAPQTPAEYDTMAGVLAGVTITFTFTIA
jgi:hypothetical protein